jgi:WD40 repeat protein
VKSSSRRTPAKPIWYSLDGFEAASIAAVAAGFDAHFVAGGRVAVVGGSEAQIIDPRSPQSTQRFAFGVGVTRLAVDNTSRLLATIDESGSIQLWDTDTVVPIGNPLRPRNGSSSGPIRFSADGRYLLVSGSHETTWIKVSTADWQPIACGLVTEPLSSFERARYVGPLKMSDSCS